MKRKEIGKGISQNQELSSPYCLFDSHLVQTVQVSPVFLQVSVKSIVWICLLASPGIGLLDSLTPLLLGICLILPLLHWLYWPLALGFLFYLAPAVTAVVWYRFYCPTDPLLLLLYPISRYILRLAFDVTMKA